jgi:hypothetical protein
MIEVLFIACTVIGDCRSERMSFMASEGELSVFQCAKYGQHHLQKWTSEHPGYRIRRWRCGPAGQFAKA